VANISSIEPVDGHMLLSFRPSNAESSLVLEVVDPTSPSQWAEVFYFCEYYPAE
jgi:hypothetical protein